MTDVLHCGARLPFVMILMMRKGELELELELPSSAHLHVMIEETCLSAVAVVKIQYLFHLRIAVWHVTRSCSSCGFPDLTASNLIIDTHNRVAKTNTKHIS